MLVSAAVGAPACLVQEAPSGEVKTRPLVPPFSEPIATKPAVGPPYAMPVRFPDVPGTCAFHMLPFGVLRKRHDVPAFCVMTKVLFPYASAVLVTPTRSAARDVQVTPSGDVS